MTLAIPPKPQPTTHHAAPETPSERYGADTAVSPWSRVIDCVLGAILLIADVEEFIDFVGSQEVLHLLIAVGLGVVLFGYVIRVGTRDL